MMPNPFNPRTRNPMHSLPAAAWVLLLTGCYTQQQYDQALQRGAELQVQLDTANTSIHAKTEELQAERRRIAELTEARRKALDALDESTREIRQLRKTLEAARAELNSANASLQAQRAELQHALDSQKEARSGMEYEVADRNRQIDILRSRVRQLERELRDCRQPPTTTAANPSQP